MSVGLYSSAGLYILVGLEQLSDPRMLRHGGLLPRDLAARTRWCTKLCTMLRIQLRSLLRLRSLLPIIAGLRSGWLHAAKLHMHTIDLHAIVLHAIVLRVPWGLCVRRTGT